MRDMASGVIYFGKLPPGKTRTLRNGVFASGLASLGLPPKTGYHVEVTPSAEVRLVDGTVFSGAHEKFSFEFNYPNPTEVESIKTRFKQLLARPDNQFESGALFTAFSQLPEVRHSVTLDEVLSALKSRSWVDGKAAGIIGDTNFLKWLEPALDDKRIAPDCLSEFDSRPRPTWNQRICDYALRAVLMILDGDSWSAFKKAGIEGWRTREKASAAHDRVIADLIKRLRLIKDSDAK